MSWAKRASYSGQFLNKIIGCSQGGQSDLLTELGKGWICKEWHMAHQLVTDIRFRGVHGLAGMPDVLGGMEDAEGQASQEVPGAE